MRKITAGALGAACPYYPRLPNYAALQLLEVELRSIGFASNIGAGPKSPNHTPENNKMAYIKQKKKEELIEDLSIYAIHFPADNCIFIDKCNSNSLEKTYKRHYYCENSKTKEVFKESKNKNKKPPMFLLQQLNATRQEAFYYQIAWEKYFLEHGFKTLSGEKLKQYTSELKEESYQIYTLIKEISIDDICNSELDLFPDFGRKKTKSENKSRERIHINVKPEEYEMVKKKAERHNMTITAYARSMILNEKIIDIDVFKILVEFIKCFNERNKLLKEILTAFYVSGKYHPMDLKIIQDAIKETREQKIQVIKDVSEILNQLKNESDN